MDSQTSKLTNILLAIIAVCLAALVLKPTNVVPPASAQALTIESDMDRTGMGAASKIAQAQVEAIKAVADAIEKLAKSGDKIALSLDNIGTALNELGGKVAESSAARPGGVIVSPEK